jgi:hypothetical protein
LTFAPLPRRPTRMLQVVPLRYGTAFKKAFSDPLVFDALIQAAIGVDFHTDHVEQEYSFKEPVARVNISYDLFAEDIERRAIVELQHIRDDESFDRFLYYHCIGLAEQIQSSERYTFARKVYTLVVLTRWPKEEPAQFGRAVCDLDPVTEEGRKLGVYGHRLVFINARAPLSMLPPALHTLARLFDDTLDGQVDENQYPDEVSRHILARIERSRLDPTENAQLKEEAEWEATKRVARDEGKKLGLDEGRRLGLDEGRRQERERSLREAISDLCELLGLGLSAAQQAHLASLDLAALEALRAHLKDHKAWPT